MQLTLPCRQANTYTLLKEDIEHSGILEGVEACPHCQHNKKYKHNCDIDNDGSIRVDCMHNHCEATKKGECGYVQRQNQLGHIGRVVETHAEERK
jgi:hypothetical protein